MRHLLLTLLTLIPLLSAAGAPAPDYSGLTARNHPRMFLNDKDFKQIRKDIARDANPHLSAIHDQMMRQAQLSGLAAKPLVYKKDESGRRILSVSRSAIFRIVSAAYAYRMTGERAYLEHAENDILTVCDFPDWNPSHFLDVAEMATAVSIGYDWLYKDLSARTRKKIVETLNNYAFLPSHERKFTGWLKGINNWNQVCNGGLVCAALATWESNPEESRFILERAIPSNRHAMEEIYGPDGAYPEGPGYWGYGTSFQVLLLSAMESAIGTDFGLSETPGFARTGAFIAHVAGPSGKYFNFSDSGVNAGPHPCLWYFADKFGDPGLVAGEYRFIEKDRYRKERVLFLALPYAARIKVRELPAPKENSFSAQGQTPLFLGRTGWGKNDLYLAVKGGSAFTNHAHMDAGEFVYDADGVRWAMDYNHPSYSKLEVWLKPYKEGLFSRKQEGRRWQFFAYNNRQHNTLTVNDRDHYIKGRALLTDSFDDEVRGTGCTIDYGDTFYDDLAAARRTARIRERSYLEVADTIETKPDAPAHIRWSMVTPAQPELTPDGILLTIGNRKQLLHAEGHALRYHIWEANMDTYGPAAELFDPVCKGTWIVGYEADIPAGSSVTITTTLKKQ